MRARRREGRQRLASLKGPQLQLMSSHAHGWPRVDIDSSTQIDNVGNVMGFWLDR